MRRRHIPAANRTQKRDEGASGRRFSRAWASQNQETEVQNRCLAQLVRDDGLIYNELVS
jgi:hypothetical protein